MSALIYDQLAGAAEADESERRIAPRTKVLKRGQIIFNNHFSTFDCIVRNISATGALLTLDEMIHLPKEFDLRIGDERGVRPARLVYRRGALAGIRFVDVPLHEESASLPVPEEARPAVESAAPPAFGGIRKIRPEALPRAVARHFRWL